MIIGDPDMKVSRAGFIFHFNGSPVDKDLIRFIEKNDMQVIIPGEIVDWTIGEYVQDAVYLGKKRALLNVGHFNWEETEFLLYLAFLFLLRSMIAMYCICLDKMNMESDSLLAGVHE